MTDASDYDTVLTRALDAWADGIRKHEPELVASYFTEDAIFQGFDRTHVVGRAGVTAYYDKQPVGLDPQFTVLETRELSADTLLAYVDVDFAVPAGEVIPVHLTVVLGRFEDSWLIRHYHVSKIGA
ncbi:YybH family protein [Leifsonia poae]|uniref:YybH family protein n=1 Tax=Leifsonia poae TaxID=110933 RepID=UPI003D66DB88